jgi:hypothetical protein
VGLNRGIRGILAGIGRKKEHCTCPQTVIYFVAAQIKKEDEYSYSKVTKKDKFLFCCGFWH